MRRMIFMALGAGLLGAAVGCNCVHGICDCDRPPPSVLHAEPPVAPGAPPAMLHAETIPSAPTPVNK